MRFLKIIGFFCCLLGGILALFLWAASYPERLAQEKAPDGIRVVLVDFPSDPNIVSYDPSLISSGALFTFGRQLCGDTPVVSDLEPTFVDRLRDYHPASIVCGL
ncbi:hypothetical protein [Ruegeria denitrificans]|uniref:hypothetical protein n=1 Tax=Ruegeria denitrificans TaxID=1715692 RepID=UPI003C7C28C9